MLLNDQQWGHVKDVLNVLGKSCSQGCKLLLQPCEVNAPRLRNGKLKCVIWAGKHNKGQSRHQQSPQLADSSRRSGGPTTDPLGLRNGQAAPEEPRRALRVRPRGWQPAHPAPSSTAHQNPQTKPFPPRAARQILLSGESPNVLPGHGCHLLTLPQQRGIAGCRQGCSTHAASA